MRSEQEVLDLIMTTAREDERIRAAMMNGSRVNPNARRDPFQDFDITFFVTDVTAFRESREWVERFGELMILQIPEAMEDPPPMNDGHFAYLMQFTDGYRIDLTLFPIDRLHEFERESLSLVLLDKDEILPSLPPPSDIDYLPTAPTAKAFEDCCNEFWWVSHTSRLWREEIVYAKYMLDQVLREQLMKMLSWYVGLSTGFSRPISKAGRHLKQCLPPRLWNAVDKTYSDAGYENTWDALMTMCALFRELALEVAARFALSYSLEEDHKVSAYLAHIRSLPKDATRIY